MPDTVEVRVHRQLAPLLVPIRWLDRIDISRGRQSAGQGAWHTGRAALIIGVVLGAVIGSEVANSEGRTGSRYFGTVLSRIAIYGGSITASAALWGALHPGERWEPVALPAGVPDRR
jgi:hypothetical protein